MEDNNCPFYGHYMYLAPTGRAPLPFVLLAQDGNQCALVVTSESPCHMQVNRLAVIGASVHSWRMHVYR